MQSSPSTRPEHFVRFRNEEEEEEEARIKQQQKPTNPAAFEIISLSSVTSQLDKFSNENICSAKNQPSSGSVASNC